MRAPAVFIGRAVISLLVPKLCNCCHDVAVQPRFSGGMKDDAPPKDLQLRDPIRRLLVRYIKRARQRVTNQKRKKRQPVRLVLPSKSGIPAWSLAFAGTLFASVFLLVATSLPAMAVELVNPHAVLEETRRHLIEFDKRMQRYKAERQKEEKELEARQKREEAERREREKAEKALAETRRKRDAIRTFLGSAATTQTHSL